MKALHAEFHINLNFSHVPHQWFYDWQQHNHRNLMQWTSEITISIFAPDFMVNPKHHSFALTKLSNRTALQGLKSYIKLDNKGYNLL